MPSNICHTGETELKRRRLSYDLRSDHSLQKQKKKRKKKKKKKMMINGRRQKNYGCLESFAAWPPNGFTKMLLTQCAFYSLTLWEVTAGQFRKANSTENISVSTRYLQSKKKKRKEISCSSREDIQGLMER